MDADREAGQFVEHETAFHLGALVTEQSHPATRGLAELVAADTAAGVAMLQGVDRDVVATAQRVAGSAEYAAAVATIVDALRAGGRLCVSGCGATGRLAILLEAAWRAHAPAAGLDPDAALSIMTGGDYALVRSVESFEDYPSFGRRQVHEVGLRPGDVLIAVSEGGETSSVIGTVWAALEVGARVIFACNNPLDVLAARVERSRRVIDDDRVLKLDLSSGPMAVAGSTRMQATTAELLILGAALDEAIAALCGGPSPGDPTPRFAGLLEDLSAPAAVAAMAGLVDRETAIYRAGGAVTYFADAFLIDIFTDTTERSPTFNLPPFRKLGDESAPRPWAFCRNPLLTTAEAYGRMLGRRPRCLDWTADLLAELGAAESIVARPPRLDESELFRFRVGNEPDPSRTEHPADTAVLVTGGAEPGTDALRRAYEASAAGFAGRAVLAVGPGAPAGDEVCWVPCALAGSPTRLWEHLAMKLVLNTVSTATAAKLGRVVSNWMAYVETTNKKLIDRGTRLVAELAGLDYPTACVELHRVRAELAAAEAAGAPRRSPVAVTLERLGKLPAGDAAVAE